MAGPSSAGCTGLSDLGILSHELHRRVLMLFQARTGATPMKVALVSLRSVESVPTHELRFTSLHHPGRGVVVPCDESGRVDLDALSDRLRAAYLGARAMVGRDYLYPTVQRTS